MKGNGLENTGREHRYKFNGIEEVNDFGLGLYTAKYRTYDPAIGRWLQIDPEVEQFYSLTPYNNNFNNPVRFSDPDGDLPVPVIGFFIGAGADIATQIATNIITGESATNIDFGSALVSGVAGALSGGLSVLAKAEKVGKLGAAAAGVGIAASESLTKQAISNDGMGTIDEVVMQTASDVVMGEIGGSAKLVKESNINLKTRKADRASRISKNDPRSSGRKATANKTQKALNRANNTNDFTGGAAGNSLQNTSDATRDALKDNGSGSTIAPRNQITRDNTNVNIPIRN